MRICFDMDGTIANLYGVEGWLENLMAEDVRPYREAAVLLNMNSLARKLNKLQKQGHEIVVISWLSKCGSDSYNEAVTEVKKAWLKKHLGSVKFNEINIVKYGYNKSHFCNSAEDILFDDEEKNRNEWKGIACTEKNLIKKMRVLLK